MAAAYDPGGPPGRALSFVVAVTLTLMLALQPDFGQAGLVIATWSLMYFAAGAPVALLGGVGGGVIAAGWFAYQNSEHVARRIDGFLASEVDPRTQIGYATNAIQEGGFLGVGPGNGQVKWILPDAHTDFIIAVAAEEFGLILCVTIMALYMTIVVRSLLRLVRERDPFTRLAGTGLAALLGMQALINMGVAVRLLPAKGMTLPLISYGGSSLIAAGLGLGVLLAMTRKRPQHEIDDILGSR
jgi:cell division protein FtsW